MRWFALLIVFFAGHSHAGLFKITNRNYGSAGAYKSKIDPVFDALEASVNALLPVSDNASFMTSMANNAVLSGAGNQANYGSPFEIFEAGVSAGLSVQSTKPPDDGSFSLNKVGGVGAQGVLRGGVHLNRFGQEWLGLDLNQAWLYLGLFTYDYSQGVTNFRFGALSIYGQYRVLAQSEAAWGSLKWNGLNVGTGLRFVSLKVESAQPATEKVVQQVNTVPGNPTVTATYNGVMNLGADEKELSLPLEVSTSVRLLYAVTFFVGLGADISLGKSSSIANTTGPVTITESTGAYGTLSGDASLDLGNDGSPSTIGWRSFSGLQLETGFASVALISEKSIPKNDEAVGLSLRAYW